MAVARALILLLACIAISHAQPFHGRDFTQTPGFIQFCQRLVQERFAQLQQAPAEAEEGGETIVARTVTEDGVSISVENNPKNVVNNTVRVTPIVFNIADVNLEVTRNGTALFMPFEGVDVNAIVKRAQEIQAGGAAEEDEGVRFFVPKDKVPQNLIQCAGPVKKGTVKKLPAKGRVVRTRTHYYRPG